MRLQMKSILACIGFVWAIAQMAVEKGFRSWFQDAEHIQMGHTEMKIKVDASAKASWLSGIQDLQFISAGRNVSFKGVRFTWGLEQRGDKRVVVQAHWSSPPKDT